MLAIGLTLSSLFISKLRSTSAARNTTVSLYAADSAVEMCLYEARQEINQAPLVMSNGATFTVNDLGSGAPGSVDISNDCSGIGTTSFTFRATGRFRGTSRTLEISQ